MSIAVIIALLKNRFLPSAIAVFTLGLAIILLLNPGIDLKTGFYLPSISQASKPLV